MTVIPEPLGDGPERDEADRETRQAHPKYYWFDSYDGPPKFPWNETEVLEDEFRAKAEEWQLERLD